MIEIHAYHGWGFDASFWDELAEELPTEIIFKRADRGYFGKPAIPKFEQNSSLKIIFTHSFGLHWVDTAVLAKADHIVVFNGFEAFISNNPVEKRRELKILNRMIDQFDKSPSIVLEAFYENCFYPKKNEKLVPDSLNSELLLQDLKVLSISEFNIEASIGCFTVLSGAEDKIVPTQRTAEIAQKVEAERFEIFEDVGHALPITKSSECWSFLSRVVPIFGQHAERNETE